MDISQKTIDRIQNEKTRRYLFGKFGKHFESGESLLANGIELLNICEDKKIQIDSAIKIVFHYLYIKALNHFWGIFLLCKEGFGDQASILLRVLVELLVNMKYIDNDEEKAKRFAEYEFVARKKQLNVVEKYESLIRDNLGEDILRSWREEKTEINQGHDQFKDDYITDRRQLQYWSGKSISEMAKESNMAKDYDFVYGYMSLLVHSSPGAAQRYMETGTTLRLKPGPSEELIDKLLLSSSKYFLEIMLNWESAIGLGETKRLKSIVEGFS